MLLTGDPITLTLEMYEKYRKVFPAMKEASQSLHDSSNNSSSCFNMSGDVVANSGAASSDTQLPEGCQNKDWIRSLDDLDVAKLFTTSD